MLGKTRSRSKANKGPMRSKAHLDRVRALPCLVCQKEVPWKLDGPSHAHHIRESFPRTMGKRIGDDMTVPLCAAHHEAVHKGDGQKYWDSVNLDPVQWCKEFIK